jgi:hypothetical protein
MNNGWRREERRKQEKQRQIVAISLVRYVIGLIGGMVDMVRTPRRHQVVTLVHAAVS